MSSRHVFVFGITGTQGKAVALAMRQGGWQVTGLTRNKDGQVALGE
jgi:nucleoside-diphosphate-sugar epimerase